MIAYVDASVVAAEVAPAGPRWRDWLTADIVYSSELVAVEVKRMLHRLLVERHVDEESFAAGVASLDRLLMALTLMDLSPEVLKRAGEAFPTRLKTLDALHVATAVLVRDTSNPDLVFVTADHRQATAARALSFAVIEVR